MYCGCDFQLCPGNLREIRLDGFEVGHIVHRHGLDEKTAYEVEAALIEAGSILPLGAIDKSYQPGVVQGEGYIEITIAARFEVYRTSDLEGHLLIDFWDAKHLQDASLIERAMRDAATACGATVLEIKLHSFGEDAGITGVAILAESHISIHTWPEINYIALDVFVCGTCDPHQALAVLREVFEPQRERVQEFQRGL